MVLIGSVEVAIGLGCFVPKTTTTAMVFLAWMVTNFLIYRLSLWWLEWKGSCPCLGSLTENLGISTATADAISSGLLAYLLIVSYSFLFLGWRNGKRVLSPLS